MSANIEAYRRAAHRMYDTAIGDNDIEIDADAAVSMSPAGAWIAAWLWVPVTEVENGQ